MHQRDSKVLMIEVFEIIKGLTQPTNNGFFFNIFKNTKNRNFLIICNENKKTVRCAQETIKFRTASVGQVCLTLFIYLFWFVSCSFVCFLF